MRILVILADTLLLVVLIAVGAHEPHRAVPVATQLALAGYLAWWLLAYPRLVVEEHRITVVNPLKTHEIRFAHLVDVSTRFGLHLVTATRRIHVVGAPSGGVGSVKRALPDHVRHHAVLRGAGAHEGISLGDLKTTVSGQAAHVIVGHWTEQVETGQIREASTPPTSRWNFLPMSIAVVLFASMIALW